MGTVLCAPSGRRERACTGGGVSGLRIFARASAIAATLACVSVGAMAGLVSYKDLLARPHSAPDAKIAYGTGPEQFVELWLPKAKGLHPVILLVHGGCWLAELPGLELMDPMAEALRNKGFAVWNVEYRRIGRGQGGGFLHLPLQRLSIRLCDSGFDADAPMSYKKQLCS